MQAAPDAVFSTAVTSLKPEDAYDPNRVKCVVDNHGYAIYFSRGLIPFNKLVFFSIDILVSVFVTQNQCHKKCGNLFIVTDAGPGVSTLNFHIYFIWGFRYLKNFTWELKSSMLLATSSSNVAFLISWQSYDTKFLKIYPELPPTPLQLEEDLEQLKVLENGYKMKVPFCLWFLL